MGVTVGLERSTSTFIRYMGENFMRNYTKRQPYGTMLVVIAFLVMLVMPSISAQGQEPLDRWTDSCIGHEPSTEKVLHCLDQAYTKWDAALNDEYQTLRGLLTPQGATALKTSQRAWIAYRDAEFATIDTIYGSLQGTMWLLTSMNAKIEFVRNRVQELRRYTSSLIEGR